MATEYMTIGNEAEAWKGVQCRPMLRACSAWRWWACCFGSASRSRSPASVLALVREGSSFADGFRISVWLVGCVCVLLAFAGSSTTMRSGTVDPLAASFFPKLRPGMSEAASGTQVSSGALFVLTALVLFGLGVVLG